MNDFTARTRRLIGEEKLSCLAAARVVVLGVGGVGGYATEMLARAGVGTLLLIDGDRVELSNCNRQIAATRPAIGRFKAEVLAERCRSINPDGHFVAINRFLRGDEIAGFCAREEFDCALDAIDEVPAKVEFIRCVLASNRPVVSSMGSAGKLDPAGVRFGDIGKTFGCPLARVVRSRLREAGITRGVETVFSPEPPQKTNTPGPLGTISYLPAIFGCFCAAAVLRKLGVESVAPKPAGDR